MTWLSPLEMRVLRCELWPLFFLFIFEHVYPSSPRCIVFHSEIVSQKFASLTIVHRYLEKSNVVSVLTSQRPEAPKTDILTEVARPELFSKCHIGHLRDVKLLETEFAHFVFCS